MSSGFPREEKAIGKLSASSGRSETGAQVCGRAGRNADYDCIETPLRIKSIVLAYIPLGKIRRSQVEGERTTMRAALGSPDGKAGTPFAWKLGNSAEEVETDAPTWHLTRESGICSPEPRPRPPPLLLQCRNRLGCRSRASWVPLPGFAGVARTTAPALICPAGRTWPVWI